MAVEIAKVDVYAGEIEDRPGGLAEKLQMLAEAGADLQFVVARRQHGEHEQGGKGLVFVAPLKGAKQTRAAQAAGLTKTDSLHSLRLMGTNKAGMGAKITQALAQAGINMRGLSAAAIGNKAVVYFAFDSDADTKQAMKVLKKEFGGK
jgi:hypothetical protein